MRQIAKSLERLTHSIEQGQHVVCDQQGNWYVEGAIAHFVRRIRNKNQDRLSQIAMAFSRALDHLEKKPVVFSDNPRIIRAQHSIYEPYLKAGKQVISLLDKCSHPLIQEQKKFLLQKIAALRYRIEYSGLETVSSLDPIQFAHLVAMATEWKHNQKLIVDKPLSDRDLQKLKELGRYKEFTTLLEHDKILRENFFKWAIRDNCDVQLFVEYPATVKRLHHTHLYSRISRIGQHTLSIQKLERPYGVQNTADKIITMPFYNGKETRHYNILDESQLVEFAGGVSASIRDVFEAFFNKDFRPGDFEMFNAGIMNWNNHEIGPWNAKTQTYETLDLNKSQWWNQLPLLLKVSKEELEKTYDVTLNDGEWLACAMGARKSPSLDVDNAHGYLKVFIPMEDGSYSLYPFGKFAITFPNTMLEYLKVLTATNPAKVVYLDENIFYFFRQHANYPIVLSEKKGEELMNLLKEDILKGREGNLVFQFSGENCAHWVEDILSRLFKDEPGRLPNLFVMPLLEAEPGNPVLKGLFWFFRRAPKRMQPYLLDSLARALGSSSGLNIMENGQTVFKTTFNNSFRYNCTGYQPVHLHKSIQTGRLKGVLTTGSQ